MKMFKKSKDGTVSLQEAIVLAMPLNSKGDKVHARDIVETLNKNGLQVTLGQVNQAMSRMKKHRIFIKDAGPESTGRYTINFRNPDEADVLIAKSRGVKFESKGTQGGLPFNCPRCKQLEAALVDMQQKFENYFQEMCVRMGGVQHAINECQQVEPLLKMPDLKTLT